MDPGVMTMNRYSSFLKAPGLKFHHQMEFTDMPMTLIGKVLHLCKSAVSVFYNPSWQNVILLVNCTIKSFTTKSRISAFNAFW